MLEVIEAADVATGAGPATVVGLGAVRGLLARLHQAGIAYCHWKSNEHLGAAVAGLTDLDVLVERGRDADLARILAEAGFRRFAAPPLRAYPGIEDHLALDGESGRLVHLHLHHQLTLGERHLKGYHLPWERALLATRRLDPVYGAYVADPAIELVLLLVRAALKLRLRDRLRRRRADPDGDFARELAWLRERVDDGTALRTAEGLLGREAAGALGRLLADPLAPDRLVAFAAAVRPALREHRTYGGIEAPLRAWTRELQWIADAINRRYLHRPVPLRRVSPRGGAVVVLLGSDGSGKSTLTRTLAGWLGAKLDVVPVYFGSGDGPASLYRLPLLLAHRLLGSRLAPASASSAEAGSGGGLKARLRDAARVPWALALSLEKRAKLRRASRARNRGMIVVCDRYPQASIRGFNDGPLLGRWAGGPGRLRRALAAWEARPYADAPAPDLVLKLAVSPTVALARRPEMTAGEIGRRVQAVAALRFPPPARVVELDADAAPDEVALAAKRLAWDFL